MDAGSIGEQRVLVRRAIQPPGREPDGVSVLHQLQPATRLVPHLAAHSHRELGSHEWRSMGGPIRGRRRKNHETRLPACESHCTGIWQCRSSAGGIALGHSVADCFPVPEANSTAAEDDAGTKAQANGTTVSSEMRGLIMRETAASLLDWDNPGLSVNRCRSRFLPARPVFDGQFVCDVVLVNIAYVGNRFLPDIVCCHQFYIREPNVGIESHRCRLFPGSRDAVRSGV